MVTVHPGTLRAVPQVTARDAGGGDTALAESFRGLMDDLLRLPRLDPGARLRDILPMLIERREKLNIAISILQDMVMREKALTPPPEAPRGN